MCRERESGECGAMPLILEKVIAIFRHGDRTPVSASVNESGPPDEERISYWRSQLPTIAEQRRWLRVMPVHVLLFEGSDVWREQREGVNDAEYTKSVFNFEELGSRPPIGLLTRTGCFQMQCIGHALRRRYVEELDFLPELRSPQPGTLASAPLSSLIFVRSTAFARTIQSAQHTIMGLLGCDLSKHALTVMEEALGAKESVLESKTALPIHVRASAFETLYMRKQVRNRAMMETLNNNDNVNAAQQRVAAARARAATVDPGDPAVLSSLDPADVVISGVPSVPELLEVAAEVVGTERIRWTHLHDGLVCAMRHNLPLPRKVTPSLFDQIARYNTWRWMKLFGTTENCRVGIGPFVAELMERLERRVNGEPQHKLELISSHDSTQPLLSFLKLHTGEWPQYGSLLVIELWRDSERNGDDAHYIRLRLNDKDVRVESCARPDGLHPFRAFYNTIAPLLPLDDEGAS